MRFPLKTPVVEPGVLYVVATPIGNLEDMTYRAVKVLSAVDLVAAEDTRNSARLLSHFDIQKPLVSLHEHNEARRMDGLVEEMREGKSIAVVSDAGTPTVSDPGFLLVRAAVAAGVRVVPVPGACAAIASLSASGLPTDSYLFLGFPPKKSGRREALFSEIASDAHTLIFYESPHRIIGFLEDVARYLGERQVVVAREVTKLHEEFLRGTASEVAENLSGRDRVRGEIVLLVAGRGEGEVAPVGKSGAEGDLESAIREGLSEGRLKPSKLAKELAKRFGRDRSEVYEMVDRIKTAG